MAGPHALDETIAHDRHILLVEDEYFIADAMQRGLISVGARVAGPASTVGEALALLDDISVDGAILDVNLNGERVYPVAEALTARGIPFVFATGYGASDLPPEWRHVAHCEKPIDPAKVVRYLLRGGAA